VSPVEHHTVGEAAVPAKTPNKPDARSPEVVANINAPEKRRLSSRRADLSGDDSLQPDTDVCTRTMQRI
jgi:hypothetical protein